MIYSLHRLAGIAGSAKVYNHEVFVAWFGCRERFIATFFFFFVSWFRCYSFSLSLFFFFFQTYARFTALICPCDVNPIPSSLQPNPFLFERKPVTLQPFKLSVEKRCGKLTKVKETTIAQCSARRSRQRDGSTRSQSVARGRSDSVELFTHAFIAHHTAYQTPNQRHD